MDTIAVIKERKHPNHLPYPTSLRATVITTTMRDGKLNVSLADDPGAVKLICTQQKLFPKFKPKSSVIVRGFKTGYSCLFTHKDTTVSVSRSLNVPEEIKRQAVLLVNPPEPTVLKLNQVEATKDLQTISVQGVIVTLSTILTNNL